MTDLTPDRRAKNMRLREAATLGPWRIDGNRHVGPWTVFGPGERAENYVACVVDRLNLDSERNDKARRAADAAYIVAACNDLPLYEAALAEAEKERDQQAAEISQLRGIIAQHDLCHDLHGKVNAADFARGCVGEQKREFGYSPHEQQVARLTTKLNALRDAVAGVINTETGRLKASAIEPKYSELPSPAGERLARAWRESQ